MPPTRSIVALSLLATACAQPPAGAPDAPGPDAVVPAVARLFSACDLDALAARYAPAAEFSSPSTPVPLVGREVLRAHFAGACGGPFRPVMTVQGQRVTMLAPGAAVITGTYAIGRSDRPADKPWSASFVVTAALQGGQWLVHSQATFATPAP